jgi:hypothetical protein
MKRVVFALLLVGCHRAPNDGYALDVNLVVASDVPDATLRQIVALDLEVSGADTLSQRIPAAKLPRRGAGFRYRPAARAGVVTLAITALDGNDTPLAFGQLDATLHPPSTQVLTLTIGASTPRGDDGGTSPDGNEAPCTPTQQRCSGSMPEVCGSDGTWQSGAACPFACIRGSCTGLCVPGSHTCDGNNVLTCAANGQWDNGTACPILCSMGACATSCVEGSTQCSKNLVQTCTGGKWDAGSACKFVCSGGACTGVCTPGAKDCDGATPTVCNASGQWDHAPSSCASNLTCSAGACVCPTTPTTQCSADLGAEMQCADGVWSASTLCKPGLGCNKTTGTCRQCAMGDLRCNPQSVTEIQSCDANGQWIHSSACTAQLPCFDSHTPAGAPTAYCRVCADNTHQCYDANNWQICDPSTGKWALPQSCPHGCNSTSTSATIKGTCNPQCDPTLTGSTCTGGTFQGCNSDGMMTTGATCMYGCKDATSCKQCDATVAATCYSSTQTQTCNLTTFQLVQTTCGSGTPLCDAGGCYVCVSGTQCITNTTYPNGRLQTCSGHAWVDSGTSCGEGCNATGTGCCVPTDSCAPGQCRVIANDGCGKRVVCNDAAGCGTDEICSLGVCKLPVCKCGGVSPNCEPCCPPPPMQCL